MREDEHPDDFLRAKQITRRFGISKTELYRRIEKGTFPSGHKLSHKVRVWTVAEIQAWRRKCLTRDLLG